MNLKIAHYNSVAMVNNYSYLNQIFYISNKFDENWEKLQPYMLNEEFLSHYKSNCKPLDSSIVTKMCETKQEEFFSPKQQDSLFWTIYVLHHGMSHYMQLKNKHKNHEMEEKQHILNYMQKQGSVIKDNAKHHGIKLSQVRFKEIMSELLMDKKTSYHVFYALCNYYKINAMITMDKCYMHFQTGAENTYKFIKEKSHFEVNFESMKKEDILHIQEQYVILPFEQEKPLKGMTSYKVSDLEKISSKLELHVEDKMKKQDLYSMILQKLVDIQN